MTIATFIFFTVLVAFLTWWLTRGNKSNTTTGYFLAGRSLTGVFIAGSLLLTNLSTEQLVGLNGGAFGDGLSIMAWEVVAGVSLVVLAIVFLPRYLKSGITTIPQFLEDRYDAKVRAVTTGVFIVAYMLILLPFVLYSGASALVYMLDLPTLLGQSNRACIWIVVGFITVVGSAYAIWGGLRAVAVSDTFNGLGLLIGGLLMTWYSLSYVAGEDGVFSAFEKIQAHNPDAFQSLGREGEDVHWPTLFTGVLLLNFFYWCTNQQIIQRTFGAKNLAEGQKGVLMAAFFKILAPIILILPGIAAAYIASQNVDFNAGLLKADGEVDGSRVYGSLVRLVLPEWLTGFFAAVVIGSILSTFNSVLNSSATLFSLGVYKKAINKAASEIEVVKSGRLCSAIVALFAFIAAPLVFMGREDQLFGYFQSLNGIYFIPLLAVILVGFVNKRVGGSAALIVIFLGLAIMVVGTFFDNGLVAKNFGSGYHFMGAVFAFLVVLLLVLGKFFKRESAWVQKDAKVVDLTPWKHANLVGGILIVSVIVVYLILAF